MNSSIIVRHMTFGYQSMALAAASGELLGGKPNKLHTNSHHLQWEVFFQVHAASSQGSALSGE